jgi:hypothetical protein
VGFILFVVFFYFSALWKDPVSAVLFWRETSQGKYSFIVLIVISVSLAYFFPLDLNLESFILNFSSVFNVFRTLSATFISVFFSFLTYFANDFLFCFFGFSEFFQHFFSSLCGYVVSLNDVVLLGFHFVLFLTPLLLKGRLFVYHLLSSTITDSLLIFQDVPVAVESKYHSSYEQRLGQYRKWTNSCLLILKTSRINASRNQRFVPYFYWKQYFYDQRFFSIVNASLLSKQPPVINVKMF